ncbi:hypothetical protein RA27_18905 [Ruegeria sp. ANG-R]|uniref:hypothetical protein n=1 Tax=Ruegeria sp. ANG-R TaxID=1577903 RepID=UPI0005805B92|nr:hypothetical protein [Ruegeria sp. ANG-R]KIC38518.1 hypothetical protein RA27_18905 [Ruegeria sp. ANG-R]
MKKKQKKQKASLTEEIKSRASQPGWEAIVEVLNLIQAEIDEGRPRLRKVNVKENIGSDRLASGVQRSQTTSAELVVSEPFSDVESLDMTAEALALAFITPTKMASRLITTVNRLRGDKKTSEEETTVKFVDPNSPENKPSRIISLQEVKSSRNKLNSLAQSLEKLVLGLEKSKRRIAFDPVSEVDAD